MIGQTLGSSYRIVDKLGAGGMGEVYRATDTTLDRTVAVKVLPPSFANDPQRLARFEREAKLLASLNHPNIAHVYGFERATLEDGSAAHFLAMELVEGEELADRIRRGPIPVEEALAIAKQIAEALEDAHEHGIVHRDLKPGNIKVTPDGKVKVLDFGLAKAYAGDSAVGSSPDLSQSPTLAYTGTQAGMILGTAAYMSPEQARGKPVDKRSDIWAFGVVLYEMLTGRQTFGGETVSDVLAGVLKTDIDFTPLPADVPAAIRQLLRRCLERNPRNRLHDIADARLVIDEALLPGGVPEAPVPAPAAASSSSLRAPALVGALMLAVGAVAGWLVPRPTGRAPESVPTFSMHRLTNLPGLETHPDLSPDGKQLVYTSAASGNKDIYAMRVDGGRAINLTANSPADDEEPAFSPDGEQLVFRSSRDGGGLFVMGATGESVRRLSDEGFDPAWSPDGKQIAYSMEAVVDPYARGVPNAPLWVIDVATGSKRRLPTADAVQPAWSPDGARIAYWANTKGQRDIWTVPAAGGDPVAVTSDAPTDWSPEWSPDGRWLYFMSDRAGGMNLFRVPIDPATGVAAAPPEQVTTSVGNLGWARFSADGTRLVVSAYEFGADLDLYQLSTTGSAPSLHPIRTLRPRSLHWCRISPNAEWMACSTIGTPEDLALLRADGAELRLLTNDIDKDRDAAWSPDGSKLVFMSTRQGPWNFWTIRQDGSELRQITDGWDGNTFPIWRVDGRRVTMEIRNHGLGDIDGNRLTRWADIKTTPLPAPLQNFEADAWSPSGTLLGGSETDDQYHVLSVGAIDTANGTYHASQLPASGLLIGRFAGWLPDSRHYVAAGTDAIALVDVVTGAFQALKPIHGPNVFNVSLSRDGATLLVENATADGDVWLLEQPEKK